MKSHRTKASMNSLIFTLLLLSLGCWNQATLSPTAATVDAVKLDDVSAYVSGSSKNPYNDAGHKLLADMLVAYFRYHGVHSLMLVVCQQDIATSNGERRLHAFARHFWDNDFFVELNDERRFSHYSSLEEATPETFESPQTLRADNETHRPLAFSLPPLAYKLGILIFNLNSSCALNVLRWSAASQRNYFTTNRIWLLLADKLHDIQLLDDEDIFLPPDSEVRVLLETQTAPQKFALLDVYKVTALHPLKERIVGAGLHSARQLVRALERFGSAISYRQNLEGTVFKTGIVIAFPDMFTNIEDISLRHIDTISKVNHRILLELANRLNMSYNTLQTDNYGWHQPNGSFDGLMGRFQRYEIDFGQLAIFMRLDRIALCDFVAETFRIRAGLMFRQPPLSAVANIFAMPFQADVWISIFVLFLITVVVLCIELLFSPHTHDMGYLDTFNFVWGAMCQQGFYVEVQNRSARIIVFTTFVATLFLFTSFSANIVALLQSPSDSIRSIADLSQSPLEIGVQDTQYNKIFFTESTDSITKNLYHKKIASKGEHIYMRPLVGMEKMRTGLFAYQVEFQAGYQIVSDTFSEPEKCGLMELEPFQLPMIAIPTRKNFQYKELFRRQLRWQREVGLFHRESSKWFPQKPKCDSGVGGFVSIGITECRYAFGIFGCGIALGLGVFLIEIIAKNYARLYRIVNGYIKM